MKCCASITSATARSISGLIAEYCALRSNNGTFMNSLIAASILCTTWYPSSIPRGGQLLHPDPDTEALQARFLYIGIHSPDTASRRPHRVRPIDDRDGSSSPPIRSEKRRVGK